MNGCLEESLGVPQWIILLALLWFYLWELSQKACWNLTYVGPTRGTDLALRWQKQISKKAWQTHMQIWLRINMQWVPSCRCVSGNSRIFLPVVLLFVQCMTWNGRNVRFEIGPKGLDPSS